MAMPHMILDSWCGIVQHAPFVLSAGQIQCLSLVECRDVWNGVFSYALFELRTQFSQGVVNDIDMQHHVRIVCVQFVLIARSMGLSSGGLLFRLTL